VMPHNPFAQQRPDNVKDWNEEWCTCSHHSDVHSHSKTGECQICLCSQFKSRNTNPRKDEAERP
jgi:hypothetical protein